jgi:L-ascorbate metabolism protein UlaG (beta-lactamase superfamily)
MYLLDSSELTAFFAGDTALTPDSHRIVDEHLRAAGRELDLALLPIGHAPWWKPGYRKGHLTFHDALELWHRLGARFFIPYHWGTFRFLTSGPHEPIRRLRAAIEDHHRREDVKILEPGESFEVVKRAEGGAER